MPGFGRSLSSRPFGSAPSTARARRIPSRERLRARPVWLVEVNYLGGEAEGGLTLYFSDRSITVQGELYENYLDDLSGLGEELSRLDSSGQNASVTLKFHNSRYRTWDYLIQVGDSYPWEAAGCVIRCAWLDDDGALLDVEAVMVGVFDEPRSVTLRSFEIAVSSRIFDIEGQWAQDKVDASEYPDAEDVGEVIPVLLAGNTDVFFPLLRVKWFAKSTLDADILTGASSLTLSDASEFPASGTAIIQDSDGATDTFTWTGKSTNTLTGVSGVGADHDTGAVVWESPANIDLLLADHACHTISQVNGIDSDGNQVKLSSGWSAVTDGYGRQLVRLTVQGLYDSYICSAKGAISDGNYGTAGAAISRPDHVIKWWLVERMGWTATDIDQASFDAAGALYQADGYGFYVFIDSEVSPTEVVQQMARECRSVVYVARDGKWHLDYVPDAAPAAVATISAGELAGAGALFSFDHGLVVDMVNRIQYQYQPLFWEEGYDFYGEDEDASLWSFYGERSMTMAFDFLRSTLVADVVAHILLERKNPLMTATFDLFWEHFDLEVGDTIEITNDLYTGRKWFIESIERLDKGKARFTAREWWA